MSEEFETTTVPGGQVHLWSTSRFHTITMVAYWVWPLERETVTAATLLPHVLLRGTRNLPEFDDLQNAFSDLYGASIQADAKRKGDLVTLEFVVQVPAGQRIAEGLDLTRPALELLGQVLWDPLVVGDGFEEDRVHREKEQHRKRIASLMDDKMLYAAQRCTAEMFAGQAYAAPRYGFEEDLAQISGASLYTLYEQIRDGGSFHLFVAGPVDPDPVVAFAAKWGRAGVRGDWSAGEPFMADRPVKMVEEVMDIQQGKLNIGYRTGSGWRDQDFPAMMMYNGVLGGFPHSKLFINVRERANLAYYASSRLDAHKGVLYVMTGIPSDHRDTVMEIVDRQVEAMARGEINDEEWTWTRIGLQNQYRELQDSPYGMIDMRLAGILHGVSRSPGEMIKALDAVTEEEVAAVGRRVQKDTVYFLRGKEGTEDAGTEV